jgi:hypothetical protein
MRTSISSCIMRTTLDLDPSVLQELRRRSRELETSMGQLASELLARALHEEGNRRPPAGALAWVSKDLGKPRVDLEDKEAVRGLLDSSR